MVRAPQVYQEQVQKGTRSVPDSRCQRAGIASGEPPCQRVPGRDLDRAIANVLVEAVTPETVALTLAMQDALVARAVEAARLPPRLDDRGGRS